MALGRHPVSWLVVATYVTLAALPVSVAADGILVRERVLTVNSAAQFAADVSGEVVVFVDERPGSNGDIYFFDGNSGPAVLASGPSRQIDPAVDGRTVVYADDEFGNFNIFARDLDASSSIVLDPNSGEDTDPIISGTDVLFRSTRTVPSAFFHFDLNTGVLVNITPGVSFPGVFSIDTGRFAWSDDAPDVYVTTLGGATAPVATTSAFEGFAMIDGDRVSYLADNDIYLFDLSTTLTAVITNDPALQLTQEMAGDFIAYDVHGDDGIYLHRISTGETTQITCDSSGGQRELTGMDDGVIVFDDSRFGNRNVFRTDFVPLDGATSGEQILEGVECPSQFDHRVSLPDTATEPLFVWREDGGIVGHGTPTLGSQPSIWEEIVVFVHEGNLYWKTFGPPTQFTSSPSFDNNPVISSLTVAFKRDGDVYTAPWSVPDSEVLHGPAVDIDLDDDTLVWSEWNGSDLDVLSKNHFTGVVTPVATTAANESEPSVSAGRVAYRSDGQLEVFTLPAGPRVTLPAPNPTTQPFLWDDAVLYGDDREGDENVYVYYLSTGLEFRLTNHEANQSPTDASANWVIYDDDRMGDHVLALEFPATSICDVDLDTDVDLADLDAISLAAGQAADPTDVRDADRDGTITAADRQLCAGGPTATVPLLPWPLLAAAAAGVLLAARRRVRAR